MKITWLGHSCFKIEENGFSVVLDPYAPDSVPGLKEVKEEANLVFCSHGHGDHCYTEGVSLISSNLKAPTVTEIHSWHDEVHGAKRGSNTMRVFDFEGVRVAHLGDIGCDLTDSEICTLRGLDVLLIPVGGFYTINGKQAAALVKKLSPKIVIPMHYRIPSLGVGYPVLSTVNDFTKAMGSYVIDGGSSVAIDSLPTKAGEILTVVMTPKNV